MRIWNTLALVACMLWLGASASSADDVANTTYLDTKGQVMASLGDKCLTEERVSDRVVMVFQKTPDDMAILDARLKARGIADEERAEFILAATNNECARKAGSKCSEGTCTSGTCKQKYTGGVASCSCQ